MRDFEIAANVPEILGQMFDGISLTRCNLTPSKYPTSTYVPQIKQLII